MTEGSGPDYVASFGPTATKTTSFIIENLGLDNITMFGVGEGRERLEYVENNTIDLLLAQDCEKIGESAIDSILSILNRQTYQ